MLGPIRTTEDKDRIWYTEYQGRELDFAREQLMHRHPRTGALSLWAGERAIVESVFKNKLTMVRGARGTSKSHAVGAVVIPTWFYTAPSKVLAIGPTLEQTCDITLAEAWKAIENAVAEGTYLAGADKISRRALRLDHEFKIIGLPSKNPEHLRGRHGGLLVPGDPDADKLSDADWDWVKTLENVHGSTRLLLVIEEAESVKDEAMRVLEGMIAKANVHVVAVMNPYLGMDEDHWAVNACMPDSPWHTIKLSLFSEELFPDPIPADEVFDDIPLYVTPQDARDNALKQYSKDDPIFLSDWLGQLAPGDGRNKICPRTILEAALVTENNVLAPRGPRMGVDIGETGDPSVAVLTWNGTVIAQDEWWVESDDVMAQVTIATQIAALSVQWGAELGELSDDVEIDFAGEWGGAPVPGPLISIDDSGMSGVCDILASKGILTDAVNFGAGADGSHGVLTTGVYFKNQRAEMHWVARRGLQEGYFRVPKEFNEIWQQATWATFKREAGPIGPLIVLEKKDDIRDRYKRSPDHNDAFILACREVQPGSMFGSFGSPAATSMGQYPARAARMGGRKRMNKRQWKRIQ